MGKVPLAYPIGTPGQPWQEPERTQWLTSRTIQRSYEQDVIKPLFATIEDSSPFEVVTYGALDDDDLALYAVVPKDPHEKKPWALVTGGTHGYETSGVLGALQFLDRAGNYLRHVNIVVVPCVCPWSYERVERWVSTAVDPNRSFGRRVGLDEEEPLRTQESSKLMAFLDNIRSKNGDSIRWLCHVDLHETTQSDCTEFRPAKAARDGVSEYDDHVPDGFYLVGDTVWNHLEWYRSILRAVEKVTHIAEVEEGNTLSGYLATSRGLILTHKQELGLCAGGAVPTEYSLTTEVYPDSDRTSPDVCVKAQVEAVCAALDFLVELGITNSKR